MARDRSEIIRAYVEMSVAKDWDAFRALFTDDVVYEEEATHRRVKGPDAIIELTKSWQIAFPDLQGTVKSVVVSGDGAVAELSWEGTHGGPLEGPMGTLPPTGKRGTVPAVEVFRFEGDQICEIRQYFDLLTILAQIGATAPQPSAP